MRFAESVYRDLEGASRLTGLPINSIVTVACLEWLRRNVSPVPAPAIEMTAAWQGQQLSRRLQSASMLRVAPQPATGGDPFWVFTSAAQDALAKAQEAAERARRPWIGTSHLLQGLAEVPDGRAAQALGRLAVDAVGLVGQEPPEAAEPSARLLPTRQVRLVMRHAQEEADRDGAAQMGTDHLLLGLLLERDSRVAQALEAAGVTEAAVREALHAFGPEE
ncbi:MAG TPA: Clp protease N-terminal domain-containing protein [Candidatus Dormibacteraeota bacterium]